MKRIQRYSLPCGRVARHIQEKSDEDLNSYACRRIKRHLSRCANCTAYLDSLRKVVFLYRRYPDPTVPVRVREKLLTTLDVAPRGSRSSPERKS